MSIKKESKGFTIIEVVLVLAIAGLIFLMVFIALPALQRSQRDAQRKNDLSRLNTALTSYQSNNRGSTPSSFTGNAANSWPSLMARYVRVDNDRFADPTGADYILKNGSGDSTPLTYNSGSPVIRVTVGSVCDGENLSGSQGDRKVAFQMALEGGGVACANN